MKRLILAVVVLATTVSVFAQGNITGKVVEKDTQDEVQRRLQTPEAQAEFRAFVDAENERRRRRAG